MALSLKNTTRKCFILLFAFPIYKVVLILKRMHSSECSSSVDLLYVRNPSSDTEQPDDKPNEETFKLDFESIITSLDDSVEELKKSISMVIEKRVSHGIWEPTLKRVKVVDNKGLKQYLPHYINGQPYLLPFEALFALECRILAIYYHDVPLSIEDGYGILLKNKNEAKLYQVFSTLSKSGYYVQRKDNTDTEKSDTTKSEPINSNKHLIEDGSHDTAKKLKSNDDSNNSERKDNVNYKVMTSIRPLSANHLRNFSNIDQKTKSYLHLNNEAPKSILYCLRDSAVPVEMNKRLKHLYEKELRPLLDLSAIQTSGQLFTQLQLAGPKNSSPRQSDELNDKKMSVDFEVFPPKTSFNASRRDQPLFRVVTIINENDPLPPVSVLRSLQSRLSTATKFSPLLFALISDSLEFNFYALESLSIGNEYPTLWEKYYAAD